jgi:hypothetical protein
MGWGITQSNDSFSNAVLQGFEIGHRIENDKQQKAQEQRLKEAQQIQNTMHQLQVQGLIQQQNRDLTQQKLSQDDDIVNSIASKFEDQAQPGVKKWIKENGKIEGLDKIFPVKKETKFELLGVDKVSGIQVFKAPSGIPVTPGVKEGTYKPYLPSAGSIVPIVSKEKEQTNTTNNWIEESQERDANGKLTPKAIQAQANLDKLQKINTQKVQTTVNINQAAKQAEGFKTWTPEAKTQEFMEHIITNQPPVNVRGLAGTDRQQYAKEFAQYKVDKGLTPQIVSAMKADYRANNMSLSNMTKQEAPMSAFVGNINKQIAKLQTLISDADRTGLRLADLPLRELRLKAKGSGKEAVISSYLLEVSNEIGKLSSGASASVQQLSDSAKEDWKKVHDPNLSAKELMIVLNGTRDQANMRMATWRDAKEEVRNQLRNIGVQETPTTSGKYRIIKVQ